MPASLTLTALDEVPTIVAGDDLAKIALNRAVAQGIFLQAGDVLILAQKIVSKAEGRLVRLADVRPSREACDLAIRADKDPRIVELILKESTGVVRCRSGVLVVEHRLGFILANAGIDASNVEAEKSDETVLLLPENPDASAERIRRQLLRETGAEVGVVINDSFGRAWRLGTTGTAIGVAGLPGLVDMRGQKDRAGRVLQVTEIGVADELAAAASLLMGQASESRPIIHARGFPYASREGTAAELLRPKELDMFR
ncbi:coenzyme F420-0:L-glutamate ligase [Parvibaculum sp.]|uniref:coenzyme F420-0:L-glutamate ligase n=1 Tax=Parvibaculum sp. TaxID=2024848 RepID=UPI001DD6234E|nr:coenzyme F420-0:L-glutamate ligase [Parvibaculum sp.]MBX3490348.1 coenzyme F420-0:L-glutamate ligase [Parvibaculum sp.]